MSQDKKQPLATGDFDPEKDIAFRVQDFWYKNKNTITIVVVLASLLFAVWAYMQRQNEIKVEKASNSYSTALAKVNKDTAATINNLEAVYASEKDPTYKRYSAYRTAQLYLGDFKYQEALDWFDKTLAEKSKDNFLEVECYEGKAKAFEGLGKMAEAKEMYLKAIDPKLLSHRVKDISWNLALLEKKSGNVEAARSYCQKIVDDTTSITQTTQLAQTLLSELEVLAK